MAKRTFVLRKLVRDYIPDVMQAEGDDVTYVPLDGDMAIRALIAKVEEEAKELAAASPVDQLSELADLQDLIEEICRRLRISETDLRVEISRKRARNGGFDRNYFVEQVTVDEGSRWVEYYIGQYPEVPGQ